MKYRKLMRECQRVKKRLANAEYGCVYFLHGTEVQFIDEIVSYIEINVLPPKEKVLNLHIYDGKKQPSLYDLLGKARCLPMMGKKQVIIVKEAQEIHDLQHVWGQMVLNKYCKNASPHTLLVFAYRYKRMGNETLLGSLKQKNHVLFTAIDK